MKPAFSTMKPATSEAQTRCVFLALLLSMLLQICHGAQYTVGDSQGWQLGVDLPSWGSKNSFQPAYAVFDTLGQHPVYQVTEEDFQACNIVNPIDQHTGATVTITLAKAGSYYFICGVPGHCVSGMKLAITVHASSSSPPAQAPVASSTPSAPPPASSSGPPAQAPVTSSTPSAPPPAEKTPLSPEPVAAPSLPKIPLSPAKAPVTPPAAEPYSPASSPIVSSSSPGIASPVAAPPGFDATASPVPESKSTGTRIGVALLLVLSSIICSTML